MHHYIDPYDSNDWSGEPQKYEKPYKKWVPNLKPCMNPSHNPPGHLYLRPGQRYVHICPGCKKRTVMVGGGATFLS